MKKKCDDEGFYDQMMETRPVGVSLKNTVRIGGSGTGLPEIYIALYQRDGKRYFAEFVPTSDGPQWQANQISDKDAAKLRAAWAPKAHDLIDRSMAATLREALKSVPLYLLNSIHDGADALDAEKFRHLLLEAIEETRYYRRNETVVLTNEGEGVSDVR